MQQFLRSLAVVTMVWFTWFLWLVGSGALLGVDTINTTFLRVIENFANTAMVMDILHFFLVMVVLLLLLSAIVYWISRGLELWRGITGWEAVVLASIFPLLSLHLMNSLFYPVSATAFPVSRFWAEPLMLLSMVAGLALVVLAATRSAAVRIQVVSVALVCGLAFYLGGTGTAGAVGIPRAQAGEKTDGPNVLIIGVDALRPAELRQFGSEHSVMPFMEQLLESADIYEPAYTPVARTHAAWASILSGEYPLHNGVRFNLTPDHMVDLEHLLTRPLGERGYHRVWGLDERRFNDIDERYGFDKVIGPKVGAADFLITKFSDFPIINVFANTGVAERFLPYIYINRGNIATYVPYQFNTELVRALDPSMPNFMAVHLCMPHYPFVANMMKRLELDIEGAPANYERYLSMLNLADRQLKDLLGKLQRTGYLDNTLVYLMSDHGEGFPGIDQPLANGNPYAEFDDARFGHGTSLLTLSQYRVLLARVRFVDGQPLGEGRRIPRLSSLVDIAADISDKLAIDFDTDGVALDETPEERVVFLESSFAPTAVSSERISELRVLQQSISAYNVNDQGRMRFREEMYGPMNEAKQRAAISSDGTMVALYPDEKNSALVVDMDRETWWPTAAMVPETVGDWKNTLSKLCEFYREDPSFHHRKMCSGDANTNG